MGGMWPMISCKVIQECSQGGGLGGSREIIYVKKLHHFGTHFHKAGCEPVAEGW
jgi:hypothetical protein